MDISFNSAQLIYELQKLQRLPDELRGILQRSPNPKYLDTLAALSLDPSYTPTIYATHEKIFVEISSRWLASTHTDGLAALAAYARILPLAPHLVEHATALLKQRRSGTLEALASQDITSLQNISNDHLQTILLALCRLLMFDNTRFATWVSPAKLQMLLSHYHRHIRYLAIRILCLYLHASDAAMESMVKMRLAEDAVEGPWDNKTIDYTFFSLWERKRLESLKVQVEGVREDCKISLRSSTSSPIARTIKAEDFSSTTAYTGGVLVPRTTPFQPARSSIVPTITTIENMKKLGDGINSGQPLMLIGLPGAGKIKLIKEVARIAGKDSSMVTFNLNEQTDARLLVGFYTSAQTPDSFSWRPGVLTTAVTEGRWALIEDLDRAPIEIISTLLPLIERGELLIPQMGESIRAAPGFKLIATVRSSIDTRGQNINPAANIIGLRHWLLVELQRPADAELLQMIECLFPLISAHLPRMMKVYVALANQSRNAKFFSRPIEPQELFRWSRRVHSLLQAAGVTSNTEPISERTNDDIFLEAVACFAGSLPPSPTKAHVVNIIAQELQMPESRVEHALNVRKPAYLKCDSMLQVGRAVNHLGNTCLNPKLAKYNGRSVFAMTDHALRILESVAVTVQHAEPCLLVGETGTGKTTIVQQIATALGHNLTVVNLSQQSEAGDILGGYKPVNLRSLAVPLKEEFDDLLRLTIPSQRNQKFRDTLNKAIARGQWARVLTLWKEAILTIEPDLMSVFATRKKQATEPHHKKRRLQPRHRGLKDRWAKFAADVGTFQMHLSSGSKGFAFSFVESKIVKAARNGDWVLLDEINLASPDTLESLAGLLPQDQSDEPSLLLPESGNIERIFAHKDFRIFGAMNPATDVGRRDLLPSFRARFTEIAVDAPDKTLADIVAVVKAYLGNYCHSDVRIATDIAKLYLETKKLAEQNQLVDGAHQNPHFSLRTLTRTLVYITDLAPIYGLRRALFEGFCMSFLTRLNAESRLLSRNMLDTYIWGSQKNKKAMINQNTRIPEDGKRYVRFKHYWVAQGNLSAEEQPHYIITPFVEQNLLNVVRATSTRKFPVLLQGPTSSGKTSMVEYLARISGNCFVRLNNHEYTDIHEYLGTYISTSDGCLEYQDGALVRALKEGHWIVLDELNLAPTDILEALNRLLDDNRELLIPETQQVVRPHENFMLFATQNPPGVYGGRKTLSRAFRNRFLELHFDDIPEDELETILRERSQIAPSFCTRIVAVYKKLSVLRQTERLFEHRNSFATLRDLFRWASRTADDREQLAINGFMLLAERVRNSSERTAVKKIIEEVMNVKLDEDQIYSSESLQAMGNLTGEYTQGICWTKSMRRLYILVMQALRNKEPVLLIGETGSGKTIMCQAVAEVMKKQLHIVNAHHNMETGDLIGAQRPLRNRAAVEAKLVEELVNALKSCRAFREEYRNNKRVLTEKYDELVRQKSPALNMAIQTRINHYRAHANALFEWSDGSLVTAMKNGQHFLLDEISLADDSVLERLNSLLEPGRALYIAEKGPVDAKVTASDGFQFLATMNPGGDYGKRELSPALRNRFTEIWVPPLSDQNEIIEIVYAKLHPVHKSMARPIVKFAAWYTAAYEFSTYNVSLRDLISWVTFLNGFDKADSLFGILHGACMVFLDRLGANPAAKASVIDANILRERQLCISKLEEIFGGDLSSIYNKRLELVLDDSNLSIGSFQLPRVFAMECSSRHSLRAPTILNNTMKLLRALQSGRPILLEGSPGVGKTSLVAALAERVGVPLTRINLSDQTELMDLFGSDVPVEGAGAGCFGWRDAPFLRAMQNGEWVLLDEMNLASQAVLEGLNACFDHRGQVYISELDQTFSRHPQFVVFATQNPHFQGGGRKGLPASFVNRFTVVYADTFTLEDLNTICMDSFPRADARMTEQLVRCVNSIHSRLQQDPGFALHGGPWEVNLRDALRWLHLVLLQSRYPPSNHPTDYQQLLFVQRFRRPQDRLAIAQTIQQHFADNIPYRSYFVGKSSYSVEVGLGHLPRAPLSRPMRICTIEGRHLNLPIAESVMLCIEQNWPTLLVGPSGSGKSNLVLQLASITGADVVELCLNPDIDTTDLLGGFEQLDPARGLTSFASRLRKYTQLVIAQKLASGFAVDNDLLTLESGLGGLINVANILPSLHSLAQTHTSSEYPSFLTECQALAEHMPVKDRARFEWVDATLVRALEQGKWLVLDNANLCNPSILDRLNSLLEPDGFLSINERRNADGSAHLVKPHPSFRLFMTMDPRHGELSRAMRNRSVELFMPACDTSAPCSVLDPTIEPMIFSFMSFQSIDWSQVDDAWLNYVLSICFDHLTFESFGLFSRWQTQFLQGMSNFPQPLLDDFQSMGKVYQQVSSSDGSTMKAIRCTHEALCSNASMLASVGALQTLHPFNNPILLPIKTCNPWSTNLTVLGSSFELLIDVYAFGQDLACIAHAARNKGLSQMTRLERSFVSCENRRFRADSTRSLAIFLQDMGSFLRYIVDEDNFGNAENRLKMLRYTEDVLHYLKDLLSIAQSPNFEDSTFQVYQGIGASLVDQHNTGDWPKDQPLRLAVKLADKLNLFNEEWQLHSGFRMEILWRALKPPTAYTAMQFNLGLEVEKLANVFDRLRWNSGLSIEELSGLQSSLLDVYKTILKVPGPPEGFLDVKQVLETFQERCLPSCSVAKPYFSKQFDVMSQYEACELGSSEALGPTLRTLSGSPTKAFLSFDRPSKAYSSLKSLIHVCGMNNQSKELAIVRQLLPISILDQLEDISTMPLSGLAPVMSELRILAKLTAQLSTTITCHPMKHMRKKFFQFQDLISELLHESVGTNDIQQMKHHLDQLPYRLLGKVTESGSLEEHTSGDIARSEHLFNAVQGAILPLRMMKTFDTGSQLEAVKQMALHLLQCFTGCLLLYVPDRPFDPALRPKVERERHEKRCAELGNKLKALQHFEKVFSGQPTSYRIELTKQALQTMGGVPSLEPIVRPERSQLGELQEEFNNILRAIVLLSPEVQMVEDAFAGVKTAISEIELRRQDISRAISRLSQRYRAYDDVVEPLIAMLQGLDAGLAMALLASCKPTAPDYIIGHISSTTPFMGCSRLVLSATTAEDLQHYNILDHESRFHFLRAAALVKDIEAKPSPHLTQAMCHVFHTFYEEWKKQLHHDQQVNIKKTSLYRYRRGQGDSDEADEDFYELFPDYQRTQERPTSESNRAQTDPTERARQLAGLQREVLADHTASTEKIVTLLRIASKDIMHLWSHQSSRAIFPVGTEDMLSVVILNLDECTENFQHPSKVGQKFSFYADSNVHETQNLVKLVHLTQERFLELQEAWPEHATLSEVLRICTELLALRYTEPLAKLLTKAEQLHAFVYEWQVVASRECSAATEYSQLTQLIVSWRRLELSTWARLLDSEDRKCNEDADSWWFTAYETIIAAPLSAIESQENLGEYAPQLFSTLEEFIVTTSTGQYSHRLAMLQNFQRHVALLAERQPLLDAVDSTLSNFLRYYRRFEPAVQEMLQYGRHTLEREINEILLLASWKDTNIDALRDSAKRSHHRLFKIVRKYRAMLAQPVSSMLASPMPKNLDVEIVLWESSGENVLEAEPRAIAICQRHIEGWSSKPSHFTNPKSTAVSMLHMSQPPPTALDGAAYLSSLAQELVSNIKALREESPSMVVKESSETVKHLKARKRKLFSDTMKSLRQMGLRSNISAEVLAKQASTAAIFSKASSFREYNNSDVLPEAELELQTFLSTMSQVRECLRNHNDDLSHRETARSVGYLEAILAMVLRQREILVRATSDLFGLEAARGILANIWTLDAYKHGTISHGSPIDDDMVKIARWLPNILHTAAMIVESYSRVGEVDNSTLVDNLRSWKSRFMEINEKVKALPDLPLGLTSSLHATQYANMEHGIGDLESRIQAWIVEYPHLGFVLKQIEPWTKINEQYCSLQADGVTFIEPQQFDKGLSQNIDFILVAIQGIRSTLASSPNSADDPKWLLRLDSTLAQSIQKLHIGHIVQMLDKTLTQMHRLDVNGGGGLGSAAALCAMALPIVHQYYGIAKTAVKRYARLYLSLCKLTTVLSKTFVQIGRDGFCSPAESSKTETGETEKLQGGTGLGEGEAAEDISKDIQNDEDLSEIAQQGQKKKNDNVVEDQEDAVDMNHDELEGDISDASEKGEDGESSSILDQSDVEDETGDVDELDPTAVDEKLWDARHDEARKKKEGSSTKSKTSNNEHAGEGSDNEEEALEPATADDEDRVSQEGAEEDEAVAREEAEAMDSHAPEGQNLDLPEEMELDNMDASGFESDSDANELSGLSDMEDVQENEGQSAVDNDEKEDKSGDEHNDESYETERTQDEEVDENQTKAESAVGQNLDRMDEDVVEDSLLQERSEYAPIILDNMAPLDVQRFGEHKDPQNQESSKQDSIANGNRGEQGSSSTEPAKLATLGQGEPSDASEHAEASRTDDNPITESAQRKAFKKLGDALQKWHRQQRRILDASERSWEAEREPADADMHDATLEHLPENSSVAEGQALGAATNEQAQGLDEHAFDSDLQLDDRSLPADEIYRETSGQGGEDVQDVAGNDELNQKSGEQSIPGALVISPAYEKSKSITPDNTTFYEREDIDIMDKDLPVNHLRADGGALTWSVDEARQLWVHYEITTRDLSLYLTEQLRLILAPTLATKMRGDFRTGKRLNMKRIIPYIASQYKKDKIWMRRTIPSKRNYQIMLAVDNSKSMSESGSGQLAFETLALVAKSLSMLAAGEMCVVAFGDEVVVAHEFDKPFSTEAGASIVSKFSFQQSTTNVRKLIAESIALLRDSRRMSFNAGSDLWQLELIISDGVCEDHDTIRRLVRQAQEERIMIIFIIVDTLHQRESIMNMSQAVFEPDANGETKLRIKRYLDGFPFLYYLVVGDVKALPGVLAQALRQWFTEVVDSS